MSATAKGPRGERGRRAAGGARRSRSAVLTDGADYLRDRGITDARLDAEILLAHALGVERTVLHTHPEVAVSPRVGAAFRRSLEARGRGRPIAHLVGGREFYDLDFGVDETVLIPRPETESLVDWGLELMPPKRSLRVADLGTGSGCVAITLAVHRPLATVDAVDISPPALVVARRNAARHGVARQIRFHEGDLLAPLVGPFALILANPPYVAPGDPRLDPHVAAFEPERALFDTVDGDGLGFYRRLAAEAFDHLDSGGSLLVEMPEGQAAQIVGIFESARGSLRSEVRDDLAGIARVARFSPR